MTHVILGIIMALSSVIMVEAPNDPNAIGFYGQNQEFMDYRGGECLLSGPAETGKTFTVCFKLNHLLMTYGGSQGAMLRQVRADMPGSVLQTWDSVIQLLLKSGHVVKYGGKSPDFYEYWNGSRLWIGGMDRPGRVLSSERDFIYFCQAEESTQAGYEYITTRNTGRAANAPYHQFMMDCNPGPPRHHLLDRVKSGNLKMFESRHEDNPTLYNVETSEWTERGKETLRILDALTGVRYLRLRKGIWAGAEGVVYEEFDRALHEIKPFDIPKDWYRYIIVDWGFRDPMVVQWWAVNGEHAYRYREIYTIERLVDDVGAEAGELSRGELIQSAFTDHDPEKQARFERAFNEAWRQECPEWKNDRGEYDIPDEIYCTNAIKDIDNGIQKVKSLLRKDPYGKPYIAFFKNALVSADTQLLEAHLPVCTEDEFECYAFPQDKDGKPRKEKPIDKDNHGMDCTRYMAEELERMRGGAEITA